MGDGTLLFPAQMVNGEIFILKSSLLPCSPLSPMVLCYRDLCRVRPYSLDRRAFFYDSAGRAVFAWVSNIVPRPPVSCFPYLLLTTYPNSPFYP